MNQLRIFFFVLCQSALLSSAAQEFQWEKDRDGTLYPSGKQAPAGFRINEVFNTINGIPAISDPRGFDVHEWFTSSVPGKVYSARLMINLYYYYRYEGGPVQQLDAHTPTITISINDPKSLMDFQSVLFREETEALKMPVIFTDSFALVYKKINDCVVGEGINTAFGKSVRIWVLNPRRVPFFRPVTRKEYLEIFLENLRKKLNEDSEQLAESARTLDELSRNEAMKATVEELRQLQNAMTRFVAFEKSKQRHYKNLLSTMTPQQANSPAVCAFYRNSPVLKDKQGNYLEEISGELPYAPLESTEDTLATMPLFTFNEQAFDHNLPGTAFQLIVVEDAYDQGDGRELKRFLDREVYPRFPFTQLSEMMYKKN